MAKANSTGPRHIGLALLISRTHSTGPHTGKERFLGGLVCTRSTNMIAPALRQSSIDLDMKPSVMQLTLSITCSHSFSVRQLLRPSLRCMAESKLTFWPTDGTSFGTHCAQSTKLKGFMISGRFLSSSGGSVSICCKSVTKLVPPSSERRHDTSQFWAFCSR
jgi:hypothetical protein